MPTIFSRKKSVSKRAGASKGLEKNNGIGGGGGGYPATYPASPASGTGYPIDEYGRPIVGGGQPIQAAVPAFSTTSLVAGPYGGAPPHGSTLSKKDFANMQNSLGGDYGRMSVDDRSVVEGGVGGAEEMALLYGYWGVETERELSPERVEEVVRVCSAEIMRRGGGFFFDFTYRISQHWSGTVTDVSAFFWRVYLKDLTCLSYSRPSLSTSRQTA